MATHLQVTLESYNTNICEGFSRLQCNEEFVDMSLAADGYMVKVHRNILALSSPYIKAMLKSVDCSHPVIFLNNVSYEILSYILEYVYTGKVKIPTESVNCFVNACKALKIEGLQDMQPHIAGVNGLQNTGAGFIDPLTTNVGFTVPQTMDVGITGSQTINAEFTESETKGVGFTGGQTIDINSMDTHTTNENTIPPPQSINNFAALITINEGKICEIKKYDRDYRDGNVENDTDEVNFEGRTDISLDNVNCENNSFSFQTNKTEIMQTKSEETSNDVGFKLRDIELKPTYSISNRGAPQLLLNRFMYLCHHQSHKGFKKRWRCIDYRRLHCPAIIDTEGENIIARKEYHNHPFHDQKILDKCKKSVVFKMTHSDSGCMEK